MPRSRLVIAVALSVSSMLHPSSGAQAWAASETEQGVKKEFRFYRIRVYNSFHRVRPEYDRRRAAGEAAFNAWKDAGGQAHQAEALVQWFRTAKEASSPGTYAALPSLPDFPERLVEKPVPQPRKVAAPALQRTSAQRDGIYRVREVATRSIDYPENIPGDRGKYRQQQEQIASNSKKSPTVWSSVSRALLRGMALGSNEKEKLTGEQQ